MPERTVSWFVDRILHKLRAAYYHRQFKKGRIQILFIVGHMRSGSSLLVHILNSNPDILGYGETWTPYRSKRDYGVLVSRVLRSFNRRRVSETFIMDKVLHDHIKNDDILNAEGLKMILLARDPEWALPSIIEATKRIPDENAALVYYRGRLRRMAECAKIIGDRERLFFLTYHELTQNTVRVLTALQKFLNLDNQLTDQYDLMWSTGLPGKGDTSDVIRTGTIVREKRRPKNRISQSVLEEGELEFQRCVGMLSELCQVS